MSKIESYKICSRARRRPQHFYAMLTAHPFVLIYGFAYMAVMGAFYFLVPYVLGRDIYSKKAANASFLLMIVGVMTVWTTTFITHCAPLYTLYWPLPAAVTTAGWDSVSSPLNTILILMDSSSVRVQLGGCSVQTAMSSGLSSGWHTIKASIAYSTGVATIYVDGVQKLQTSCTSIPAMYVVWIGQSDLNGSGTAARKSEFDNVYSGT